MTVSCEAVAERVGLLFTCSQVNQYIRIRTPFLYPDGDVIDIFLNEKNGVINLSDVGETLRWLRMQTITLRRSKKQSALINDVCITHNVELFKGMLTVRVNSEGDLGSAVMRLAQAMLRVSDLWFTLRNQTFVSIADEVEEFLLEQRIPYSRGEKFVGRSTRVWPVDFYTRHPNRSAFISVLSTANSSVAQSLTNATYTKWADLNSYKATQGIRFISLFDDTTDVWQEYSFKMLEEISEILFWSRPDELKERLVA